MVGVRLRPARPRLMGLAGSVVVVLWAGSAGAAPTDHADAAEQGGPPSTVATTATLPLDAAAYYWREQSKSVPVVGVAPPSVQDPTVPAGDLAVAAVNDTSGEPEKETYVRLDTSRLVGGTPTSVRLALPLDTSPSAANAYDTTAPPSLTVCAVAGAFSESNGAVSFENKPKDDCSARAVGTFDVAHATWNFDITAIAARWVSIGINSGVAVLPTDPAATPPFQYVFGPRALIHATARIEPLPAQLGDNASAPSAPAAAATVPPSLPGPVSPPDTMAVPAATAQPPVVAAAPPAVRRVASAAFTARTEWQLPALAMLGVVALLAMCSLVTGARRHRKPRII